MTGRDEELPDEELPDEELMVRRALARAAVDVSPGAWSADEFATRLDGARRRRRRRAGVLVPALAAVLTAGVLIGVGVLRPSGHAPAAPRLAAAQPPSRAATATPAPAPAASTAASAASKAAASPSPRLAASRLAGTGSPTDWPAVTVVQAGQQLDIGHGWTLTLTDSGRCLRDAAVRGKPVCEHIDTMGAGWNTMSVQADSGDSQLLLVTPTFRGDGRKVAHAVMRIGGASYPMRVVRLAGRPVYAVMYVWATRAQVVAAKKSMAWVTTLVYDQNGKLLAKVPTPHSTDVSTAGAPTTTSGG